MKFTCYPNLICFRNGLALLFLLLLSQVAQSQAPDWQQAMAIGTTAGSYSEVTATALDASGNVYVAGSFGGTISLGGTTLTSGANSYAGYVAKWNSIANTWAWALPIASSQAAYVFTIAVAGNSVYIGGDFLSTATFGNITLANAVSYRGYVAKVLDTGASASFVWAQGIGGAAYDYVSRLAAQGSSVYVVGTLGSPTVAFGPFTVANPGYSTGYVAKLTDAGLSASYAWVRSVDSPNLSNLSQLVVQGPNVYVAGYFAGPAACGSTNLLTSSANDIDVVVAKLTDAGAMANFTWARQAGGTGVDRVGGLAVAGTSLYLAGDVDSPRPAFGSTTLTGMGETDIFVAKLTDAGASASFTWAQLAGGSSFEGVSALAVRGSSVYICGFTTSAQAHFGSSTLPGLGDYDAFVARLLDGGNSGSFTWARQAGSAGSEDATSLVLLGATQVLVGGYTEGPARFGPQVLTSTTTESFGFLASINDAGALAAAPTAVALAIGVYPNPAHGSVTVAVPAAAEGGTCTFTVLDALGRSVRTQTAALSATGLRYPLNLAGLPPGLYELRIGAGSQTATRCLVVE